MLVSSGASSAAARSSAVLYDAERRLPEMARMRIELRGLDRRHAEDELDLVGDEQVAVRQGLVPLQIELAAVDRAGELEADALVAPRIGRAGVGDHAGELDRTGDALDRDLAGQADLAVADRRERARGEGDLRVGGGV